MKRRIGFFIAVVAILLFASFVWPTPYWHFKLGVYSARENHSARENRFTGKVQVLLCNGACRWGDPPLFGGDPQNPFAPWSSNSQ